MNFALLILSFGPVTLDPFLRLEVDGVYSEAQVDEGDDDIDASAVAGEVTAGIDVAFGDTSVEVAGQAERIEFINPDFTDRWRHFSRVTVDHKMSEQWELRFRAQRSQRFPSAEFFDIDEAEVRTRVRFEPVRAHRFDAGLRWRDRTYADEARSKGSGPRVEGAYRYRMGRYRYLEIDARHEAIASDNPARRYTRDAVAVTYTHPLTGNLRLRPKLAYRETEFSGRQTATGGLRRDRQYTPELELLWWIGDWRTSAELQYRTRTSTDRERSFSGFRAQMTIAHVL